MQQFSYSRATRALHPQRQILAWFPCRLRTYPLLTLAALLAILFTGCNLTTPAPAATTATAQPTATPTGMFPAFSDWRLAYLGQDSRVHAVTQDGKTDLAGPLLTIPHPDEDVQGQVSIAPDGRALAYKAGINGYSGAIITLQPGTADSQGSQAIQGNIYFWSPDSTRVAYDTYDVQSGQRGWAISTPGNPTPAAIPNAQALGELFGWIDTTHLLFLNGQGNSASFYTLSSLDITSGALRQIASISTDGLGYPLLTISPDGSEVLLTNSIGEGTTNFTPVAEVINLTTGQKRHLPNILSVVDDGFTVVAWKPGTSMVLAIVSTTSNPFTGYLFDVAQDTATPFASGVIPLGWAPDTGTLFTCAKTGAGAYQVNTMAAPPPATAAQPVFSVSSATLPFLGFVRTG
jgi:hypothetical protein